MVSDAERLSPDDAHILGVESAAVTGHTLKLVVLEPGEPLDVAALRAAVAAKLSGVPRATERVDTSGDVPRWVPADVDLGYHVRRGGGDGATQADLWRIVSELMTQHLDRRHPLWTFDVVGPMADGREAIAARVHHAMFDGMAAVRFLEAVLFDDQAPVDSAGPGVRPAVTASRWDEARRLPGAVLRELGHPTGHSPFDQPITVSRELAFTVVPLAGLKAIGASRPQRATVNDALLAVVTGGLRTWLGHHDTVRRHLRAQIPVSLHHRDEDATVGNRDSFMNVDLPLRERDPLAALDGISAQTRQRKQRDDAAEMYDLMHALGAAGPLGRAAKRVTGSAHEFSLSISNVPGPRAAIAVAGRPVRHLFSSSEPAEHHALRISAISCAGDVGIGLCTDPTALPHVANMAEATQVAYAELHAASRV